MLEMTKTVLQRVSFDQTLFRKELLKATKWLKSEDLIQLRTWCLTTFGAQYTGLVDEVFRQAANF